MIIVDLEMNVDMFSELLRKTAEHTLVDMVRVLFIRLVIILFSLTACKVTSPQPNNPPPPPDLVPPFPTFPSHPLPSFFCPSLHTSSARLPEFADDDTQLGVASSIRKALKRGLHVADNRRGKVLSWCY